MNITDEQLLRGASYPNLDFDLALRLDLTTKVYRTILINTGVGYAPVGPVVPPMRLVGVLQNAPDVSDIARVRYSGWTPVVYGANVSEGDLLRIEETGSYDRVVPFERGTHGHVHLFGSYQPETFAIYVENLLTQTPVTGLTASDFTIEFLRDVSGTVTPYGSPPSVTECVGPSGWYLVTATPTDSADHVHIVTIVANTAINSVTPSQHQWMARRPLDGPPTASSIGYCLGHALSTGVADDLGLMMLRTQLF